MESCILKKEQYSLIYKVSFLSLGSCVYAIYNQQYALSICPGGVFLTSINYWRKPDYSWRRYADITYVRCSLAYQVYRAARSQYMYQYYSFTLFAIYLFFWGVRYYKENKHWHSTYAHCGLHIFANIACVFLYSGKFT
jgi:hypothetical protein